MTWLPWWLSGKESACQAGESGSIPGSGRSPGKENGDTLQYSCLWNPMGRGAWQASPWACQRVGYDLATKQHKWQKKKCPRFLLKQSGKTRKIHYPGIAPVRSTVPDLGLLSSQGSPAFIYPFCPRHHRAEGVRGPGLHLCGGEWHWRGPRSLLPRCCAGLRAPALWAGHKCGFWWVHATPERSVEGSG